MQLSVCSYMDSYVGKLLCKKLTFCSMILFWLEFFFRKTDWIVGYSLCTIWTNFPRRKRLTEHWRRMMFWSLEQKWWRGFLTIGIVGTQYVIRSRFNKFNINVSSIVFEQQNERLFVCNISLLIQIALLCHIICSVWEKSVACYRFI